MSQKLHDPKAPVTARTPEFLFTARVGEPVPVTQAIRGIVESAWRALHQGDDGTYYGKTRLPGNRYALSCNEPDTGVPGLSAAINAALEVDGRSLRVAVGDNFNSPFNSLHGLKSQYDIQVLSP